jgi:uncharacterized protein YjbI with pentapeptide repeats
MTCGRLSVTLCLDHRRDFQDLAADLQGADLQGKADSRAAVLPAADPQERLQEKADSRAAVLRGAVLQAKVDFRAVDLRVEDLQEKADSRAVDLLRARVHSLAVALRAAHLTSAAMSSGPSLRRFAGSRRRSGPTRPSSSTTS